MEGRTINDIEAQDQSLDYINFLPQDVLLQILYISFSRDPEEIFLQLNNLSRINKKFYKALTTIKDIFFNSKEAIDLKENLSKVIEANRNKYYEAKTYNTTTYYQLKNLPIFNNLKIIQNKITEVKYVLTQGIADRADCWKNDCSCLCCCFLRPMLAAIAADGIYLTYQWGVCYNQPLTQIYDYHYGYLDEEAQRLACLFYPFTQMFMSFGVDSSAASDLGIWLSFPILTLLTALSWPLIERFIYLLSDCIQLGFYIHQLDEEITTIAKDENFYNFCVKFINMVNGLKTINDYEQDEEKSKERLTFYTETKKSHSFIFKVANMKPNMKIANNPNILVNQNNKQQIQNDETLPLIPKRSGKR